MSVSDPLFAYEQALKRRGYATDAVERRVRLARAIMMQMDPAATTNQDYRLAVERVIAILADPASAARCQQVARDFLPCFVEAGRRLPAPTRHAPPPPETIEVVLPPHSGLDDLVKQALAMKLTASESRAYACYADALKRERLVREARERRLAIARLLLLGLRSLKPDGRHYRVLIERLLPLFTRDQTRSYFLGVARDFHPCVIPQSHDP